MEIGFYFRIERDGKWDSYDIAELSDDELNLVLDDRNQEWLKNGMKLLVKWIKENVQDLPVEMHDVG